MRLRFSTCIHLPRLGCALCAVLLGFARVPAADCPPESSGYAFLHPAFVGRNWVGVLQNTDLFVPNSVCSTKPQAFSISRAQNANVAVFSAVSGNFFVSRIDNACPSCVCCRCFVEFLAPSQINLASLPVVAGTPIHVVRQTGFTYDNVKFAVAGAGSRVLVITAPSTGLSITRVDTLTLTGTGNQAVRFLGGALNQSTGQDTGLWVAGTRGLLRLFPYNGTTWGAQRSYDVDVTDTVLCVGDGFAGGWSGRIYAWNGTQFTTLTRPTQAAVRSVNAQGACGDSGIFLLREGNAWTVSRAQSASYRHFNLTQTKDGSTVELLDDQWRYSQYMYRNTGSGIASTTPPNTGSPSPYIYISAAPVTVTLRLSDPDSNFEAPRLSIDYATIPLNDGTHLLLGARPNESCAEGLLLMADATPAVTLTKDSVVFAADARLGTVDALCGECMWVPYAFRMKKSWVKGSTLTVQVGTQTLTMTNDTAQHTTAASSISEMHPLGLTIAHLRIPLPGPGTIRIHDAAGRLVAKVSIHDSEVPSIAVSSLPRGILYIRHESLDGKQRLLAVVPNIK